MALEDLQAYAEQEAKAYAAENRLRGALTSAQDIDPDEYVAAMKLAAKTGVAPRLAHTMRPQLQPAHDMAVLPGQLVRESPATAAFLSDPDNAALARDDIERLRVLETGLRESFGRIGGAAFRRPAGRLEAIERSAVGGITEPLRRGLSRAGQSITLIGSELGAWPDQASLSVRLADQQRRIERFPIPTQIAEGLAQISGATNMPDALAAVLGNPRAVLETSIESLGSSSVALAGAVGGSVFGPKGTAAGAGLGSFAVEYANTMAEVLGSRGVAMTDPLAVGNALRDPALLAAAREKATRRAIPVAVFDALTAGLAGKLLAGAKPSVVSVTSRLAGEAALQAGGGAAGEAGAQAATGEYRPGEILLEALAEIPTAAVEVPVNYREAMRREPQAQADRRAFESVVDSAQASKLRSRSPEKFREFIARATENGPVQTVFIPAQQWQTYFQTAGIDPAQAAQDAGASNYTEALASGTDVAVPLADYAARIAGTPHHQGLAQDIRLHPGEMTAREAAAADEMRAEMEAQLAEQVKAIEAGAQTAQEEPGVREAMRGQLLAVGYEPQTAERFATLYAAAITTMASRAGMTPQALHERYGLTVTRPLPEILARSPTADVDLDPLLDRLRAGAGEADRRESLSDFLRRSGGLALNESDVADLEPDAQRKPGQRKLMQPGGRGLDAARELAQQHGYIGADATLNDFLDLLDQDIRGNPVFPIGEDLPNELNTQLEQLDRYLRGLNIDLAQVTDNAQVRRLMQEAGAGAQESGTRFEQGPYNPAMHPDRAAWGDFPDVPILADEKAVKQHPDYHAAKTGDADAAARLVRDFVTDEQIAKIKRMLAGRKPILISVHAVESGGINAIPEAVADAIAVRIGLQTDAGIVQTNVVGHTGADGFSRLSRQALFDGDVSAGAQYLIVDDFVGQGGTIANLRGYIESRGGSVIGAAVLTGKPFSTKLNLSSERLRELRDKHGAIENWWSERFGFGFDALTESEARYLAKTADADTIRSRVIAAEQAADGSAREGTARGLDFGTDEATGLPLNADGTVTLYHHTSAAKSEQIRRTGILKAVAEPDVYLTTRRETDTGYGDTAVAVRVDPKRLSLDDEFPDGRKDFRLSVGKPGGSIKVTIQNEPASRQDGASSFEQRLEATRRGYLQFGPDRKMRIGLLEDANLSTFIHETGHLWLEILGDLAQQENAPQQIRDDYARLLKWFGVTERSQIATEHHEQFARANESYLMEGQAPSPALREVFRRVKAWMVLVYRRLSGLNVKMSDEVRGVFDRLYATDQEIEQQRRETDLPALFLDAQTAGMTEAEFAAYRNSVAQATDGAKEALADKALRQLRRQQEAWWKEAREAMRAEVTAEVDANAAYRAFAALTEGKLADGTPIKLDKADLVRRFGEPFVKAMPRRLQRVYALEGGIDADTAAELLGFESGAALIEALGGIRRRSELIDAETDRRMIDTYGDMLNDGTLADEAEAALHNEQRATVLRAELVALRRKQRDVAPFVQAERNKAMADRREAIAATEVPPLEAFRQAAAGLVGQKQVRDIRADTYLRAEQKAARAAFKALAKGDAQTAAAQKQRELLNHYLYLEARKALEEAEAIYKQAAGYQEKATRARIGKAGADYLDQIDALLDRYEFRRIPLVALQRRESLALWAQQQEAAGHEVAIDARLLEEARRINYRQASMDELRAVGDALTNIEHLARLKNKVITKRNRVEWEQARDELVAAAQASGDAKPMPLDPATKSWLDRAGDKVAAADAALLKVEQIVDWLDGGQIDGPWHRYFWQPIAEAQADELDIHRAITAELLGAVQALPKEHRASMTDTVASIRGQPITRKGLISIALNTGNAQNLDKMLRGFNWTQGELDTALQALTAEDWALVQKLWDTVDRLWPQIADLEKRLTGLVPPKVQAIGREVKDPAGNTLASLRGGYFPLVYDPRFSEAGEKQEAGSLEQLFEAGYARATTPKGHTKARLDSFAAPLLLDFEQVIAGHMAKVAKDLTHREAVLAANRIILSPQIKQALQERIGPQRYRQLQPWLRSVVNDRNAAVSTGMGEMSRWMLALRANTVAATMGFKATTVIAQITGLFQSMDMVGGRALASGVLEMLRHPIETVRYVREKSGEMRHRADTMDRDIRQRLAQLSGTDSKLAQVQRFGFHGIALADALVSYPTWLAAYRSAIKAGQLEDLAIAEGDRAVRLTQGAGGAKDLDAVQRNESLWRYLTMFYGYFSVLYNRQRDMGRQVQGITDMPRFLARAWWMVALPAVVGELLVGRGPDDDDNPAWWALRKVLLYPGMSVPIVRDVLSSVESGFDYRFSPVAATFGRIVKAASDTGKLATGETTKEPEFVALEWAEAAGYFLGIPATAQAMATGKYLWRVSEGEEKPDNLAELAAYAALGKRKEQ